MATQSTLPFTPKGIDDADPHAAATLKAAKSRIGSIPNIYGFMANAPGLLEAYAVGDTLFRQTSEFSPAERELVYLTISRENGCRYCVAVHSTLADTMSRTPRAVTDAVRDGTAIEDAKFRALHAFTAAMVRTRARPDRAELDRFVAAGFSPRNVLDIVLAIGVKTFTNYANHFFDTPLEPAFAARVWQDSPES